MQSDTGTIFLDEISTASPNMQVKLLRVLQELEFEQVGGNKTFRVDTRVILATNDDLSQAVAEGRFRQDLFYRINVINIELPPLRDRITDIPLLARHFLRQVGQETGKPVQDFSDGALAALQHYRWPGNVRELQNVVERAVLLGKHAVIQVDDLPSGVLSPAALSVQPVSGQHLERGAGRPRTADHPGGARGQQLESKCHGRYPGHQPDDALQEDEATGPRLAQPPDISLQSLTSVPG